MFTIFSIPKSPVGHNGVIQANAVRSWKALEDCEVILFGDEPGLADFARNLGVRHIPKIACNELGTPLVSDAFEQVVQLTTSPVIAYLNADIILTSDFSRAVWTLAQARWPNFLMTGRRWDLDIAVELDFDGNWEQTLWADVMQRGVLHGKAGMDYFLFPREHPFTLPRFAVGRPGWDNFLICHALSLGVSVIDGTKAVRIIHQNHPPAYRHAGVEATQNRLLAGGSKNMFTLRNANWVMTDKGLAPAPLIDRLFGRFLSSTPGRTLLGVKRSVQLQLSRLMS